MGGQHSSCSSNFSEKASHASRDASKTVSRASEKASQASRDASDTVSRASENALQASRDASEQFCDSLDRISETINNASESLTADSFSSSCSSAILTGIELPLHNDPNNAWRGTIRQKILSEQERNPNLLNEVQVLYGLSFEDFITVLGDPDAFRTTFLQPRYNFKGVSRELFEEIEAYSQLGITAEDIQAALLRMQERRRRARDLEMKFILTSSAVSPSWWIRRAAMLRGYDFGALHAGLLVDGTLLEWGCGKCGSSIVYPVLDPSGLLIAVDVQDKSMWRRFKTAIWNAINIVSLGFAGILYGAVALWLLGTVNEEQLRKIAEICTNFNRYKTYNVHHTNCQTFVKVICDKLRLSLEFQGEMQNFVQRLIRDGKSDFIFCDQTFETRQEFDNYVMNQISFRQLKTDDQKLLLGYAHVFDEYRSLKPMEERWTSTDSARRFWIDMLEWMQWEDRR